MARARGVSLASVVDGGASSLWHGRLLRRLICSCIAAGFVVAAVAGQAEAEHWVIQSVPKVFEGALAGVSCASSSACTAVGSYYGPSGVGQLPLVERWNGVGWSVQSAVITPGAPNGALAGVSCPSSSDCVAVGFASYSVAVMGGTQTALLPLVEDWDGNAWTVESSPDPGALGGGLPNAQLSGVSCTSMAACTAVGTYYARNQGVYVRPFAERWDGTRWTLQRARTPTGRPGGPLTDGGVLAGVSCSSSRSCTAVGGVATALGALAEQWNGSAWSIRPTVDPTVSLNDSLSGVSCSSSTACVAVGSFQQDRSNASPVQLVQEWDGSRWTAVNTPDPPPARTPVGTTSSALSAVSCVSATVCTAVGQVADRSNRERMSLIERFDRRTWTLQPSPNPAGATFTRLTGVSCSSRTACIAVGAHQNRHGLDALAEALAAGSPPPSGIARLTSTPVRCVPGQFTARINGVGISSVTWALNGSPIAGHTAHRQTRYLASVKLSPGPHRLSARVTFIASSHTHDRTLHRIVLGCSAAPPQFTG